MTCLAALVLAASGCAAVHISLHPTLPVPAPIGAGRKIYIGNFTESRAGVPVQGPADNFVGKEGADRDLILDERPEMLLQRAVAQVFKQAGFTVGTAADPGFENGLKVAGDLSMFKFYTSDWIGLTYAKVKLRLVFIQNNQVLATEPMEETQGGMPFWNGPVTASIYLNRAVESVLQALANYLRSDDFKKDVLGKPRS